MILLIKEFKIYRIAVGIVLFILSIIPIKGQTLLHSHNDYQQRLPLHDAIRLGYDIIEVDIFLRNDSLVVCHDKEKILNAPTLFDVYISKLLNYDLDEIEGKILMLDIKENSSEIIEAIHTLIENHKDLFHHISILISGDYNRNYVSNKHYSAQVALDGRIEDLKSDISISRMPIISINIKDIVSWNGKRRITRNEAIRLKEIIETVHSKGLKIRFWNTHDHPQTWNVLIALGVDIIGVDDFELMADYHNYSID